MNQTRLRGCRASDAVRYVACAAVIVLATSSTLEAQVPGGWTTSETKILTPAGSDFVISGINWYGFETTNAVAHGLWSRDYTFILDQVKQYGYNTIRLPFSNQMWETNPEPPSGQVSGCPTCAGKRARDVMAMIVNYAGSIGLHVILDNHRSDAGDSAQASGLWYTSAYPEQAWIRDWVSAQEWVHGIRQTLGAPDTVTVDVFASDGFPTVIGFDLRNEPHSPGAYSSASTWGTGDGIDPRLNPNPNPFTPACVAASTCHDWRLAAERAADTVLGEAVNNAWAYPLMFVEGVSLYPQAGTDASGPYDSYWWGGNLLGVNGNSTNPGAPVVLNAGGDATTLGPPVYNQLVYSTHEYGPALYQQPWFDGSTCYATACSSTSLADVWKKYWAHIATPLGINPLWPGQPQYPWSNTGHTAVTQAPVYIGEFGTGNLDADLFTTGSGSQGQWMTSIVNFIASSYDATKTASNDSGVPASNLHWTYWAFNDEDAYALVGPGYSGLDNPRKEYSFLCFIQQGPVAVPMGSTSGNCSSTGTLPLPDSSAPPAVAPPAPTGLTAARGNAQVTVGWGAVAGATSYTVKYATVNGGPYQTAAAGLTATTYVHGGRTNGTTYYYVVSATNPGGEGPNSSQVSATPVAPAPPATGFSIWWPTDGATLSGTQPFKARLEGKSLSSYKMYWQVDGDRLNLMGNSNVDGPHKEALVNVNSWTWRANGPYVVNFVAKDNKGKLLGQQSVTIYVAP